MCVLDTARSVLARVRRLLAYVESGGRAVRIRENSGSLQRVGICRLLVHLRSAEQRAARPAASCEQQNLRRALTSDHAEVDQCEATTTEQAGSIPGCRRVDTVSVGDGGPAMLSAAGHGVLRVAGILPAVLLVLFIGVLWLLGLACRQPRRDYVTTLSAQAMTVIGALLHGVPPAKA